MSLLPFEEVFAGQIPEASAPLSSESLLAPGALASMRRDLKRLLTGISARPLLAAFSVFRGWHGPKRELYGEFVDRLQNGGLKSFYAEYPELARLTEVCVRDWSEAVHEFLIRLGEDREDLVGTFGAGAAGRIEKLEPALSDRHGGRSVTAVTFESGLKLVYKPRDMAVEQSWFDLLAWLNRDGSPADHRIPRLLAKPGYGWMEWVPHEPCQSESSVSDYFVNAGALQCILYVLHATDAHMGNVIAAGPQPVLVDAECLVQPQWHPNADVDLEQQEWNDLLLAGMMPQPKLLRGEEVDLSALTGGEGQVTDFRVPVWDHLNTDGMSLRMVQGVLAPQKNLPVWNGSSIEAPAFGEDFLRGFAEMYRYLAGRVPDLLAPDGPLKPLFECHTRVLLDHTRRYLSLMNRSLHPGCLRDAPRRRALLRDELSSYRPASILAAETKALERLDVPYFSASARETSVFSEGSVLIPAYFARSGAEVVRSRFENLSEEDLENRTSVIRVLLAMASLGL